jgi:carbon-monoxide dehydrogenase medium subunit/6-hydroxypseudooxynicotine dehydrogenase subunit alpha
VRPAPFTYERADSVEDLLESLNAGDEGTVLLAGGQSLVPGMHARLVRPRRVIDIDGLTELEYLSLDAVDASVRVGALCRHATLERSVALHGPWAALRAAARHVGLYPVRQRGTLGGSLAHAHPGAELALAAVTYDATVALRSRSRERVVLASELLLGAHRTVLEPDEAVVEVRFEAREVGTVSAFTEVSRRAVGWPLASVCAVLRFDGGVVAEVALGVGAVGPVPLRARDAERVLVGERLDGSSVAAAAAAAARFVDDRSAPAPGLDTTSRRELVATLVTRTLDELRTARVAA